MPFAKAFGTTVTFLEKKDKARKLAKSLGADSVYKKLPELIPEHSFDPCVDFVGLQRTLEI